MKKRVKRATERKDQFNFGSIFSKSIKEYSDNFKELFKFMFLFMGIISLVLIIVEIICLIADPSLFTLMTNSASIAELNEGTVKLPLYFKIITYFFNIISIFLSIFVSAALISTTLKKSKFSLRELIDNGKSRYWKFFGFNIVLIIFILLLTLLLIIPGIIFGIYWAFAAYVFFDKKEKIRASLKQSRMIIKDRWWKTLGYLLLIGLILIGFAIIVNIIQLPTLLITSMHLINGTNLSWALLVISTLLNFIAGFIGTLISVPLGTLFVKNFYLEMKKGRETFIKNK